MINVPLEFASSMIPLSWGDINWGCKNHIIDWSDAVTFAADNLNSKSTSLEMDLSITDPSSTEDIKEIMEKLSAETSEKSNTEKRNWLIIVLSWIYNERQKYSDPLEIVEEIYADFDYPPEIESIVRYMPPSDGYDPSIHSLEENKERLMENWRKIIKI